MSESRITPKQIEEAFEAAAKKDNQCPLGKLLEAVPADVATVLDSRVKDDLHYPATTVSRVLKGLGFPPMSAEVVSKHRRGLCRCK